MVQVLRFLMPTHYLTEPVEWLTITLDHEGNIAQFRSHLRFSTGTVPGVRLNTRQIWRILRRDINRISII